MWRRGCWIGWKEVSLTTVQGEKRVQDAYSIRCIPQVHGASWQVLGYVKEKLEIEMNAATDNPLIFDDGEQSYLAGISTVSRLRLRWIS